MSAEELLDQGRLEECLETLQAEVRRAPADPAKRMFLFQVLALMGQWDRALTQLNVTAELDSQAVLTVAICRALIDSELQRAEIFAGRKLPTIFGEPEPWMGLMVQANQAFCKGNVDDAVQLRAQALRQVKPVPGTIDGQEFNVLTDGDSRFGPILEAVVEGTYYWVPTTRVQAIEITKPVDVQDLIWVQALFTWSNGGTAGGYIPVRYPGSDQTADNEIKLSRKTVWEAKSEKYHVGLGQRLLATETGSFPLLGIGKITLGEVPQEAANVASA